MNNLCDNILDYINGHLNTDEKEQFEKHLEEHPACREEYESLVTLMSELPYHSPPIKPSEGMKERILANVLRRSSTLGQVNTENNEEIPSKQAPPVETVKMKKWYQRGVVAGTLVALLFLSLATNVYLLSPGQTDTTFQANNVVSLQASEGFSGEGQASFVQTDSNQSLLVLANNLEPLAGEEVYQVWLLNDGAPSPAGSFKPDETGAGAVVFHPMPDGEVDWDAVAITKEPQPGNQTPEGDILLQNTF
ncbi:anti-sigma factor [Aureibacillus halotolerans]|uniref:Regulator of SigK n=1 Tax=Aureibacillus halotolerans TaxID=1508390 RepID=A0A4R6U855_9BACI|nr:anti-sigma factor [Aureibacillus halotolerans]TDQ42718.1 anti-sigma-K factor rskA [Aureibacillus halotolerans]